MSRQIGTPAVTKTGTVIMALSLLWWFLYDAQYMGTFTFIRHKIWCITETTFECEFYRENISGVSGRDLGPTACFKSSALGGKLPVG